MTKWEARLMSCVHYVTVLWPGFRLWNTVGLYHPQFSPLIAERNSSLHSGSGSRSERGTIAATSL